MPIDAAIALSAQQTAIVTRLAGQQPGNVIVRARAGTGKTFTILLAVVTAYETVMRLPVLLAAFNKEIAVELVSKLQKAGAPQNIAAKTLHALGFGFVLRFWGQIGVENGSAYRARRLAEAVCGPAAPSIVTKAIAQIVDKSKEIYPINPADADLIEIAGRFELFPQGEEAERLMGDAGWDAARIISASHTTLARCRERDPENRIDFADMLWLPLQHGWAQPRFSLVIIDEAQDMNAAQILLAQRVCRADGRIVVVGDDRQGIYGFRGADSGSIDRLKIALNATEMGLTITYRCPKAVVALAQQIVPDYRAADTAPEGEVLTMKLEAALATAGAGDFILSRTNAPLVSCCLALLRRGQRAKIRGRDIGRGLVALVRDLRARSIPEFIARLGAHTEKEIVRVGKLTCREETKQTKIDALRDQQETLVALCEGLSGPKELQTRIEQLFEDAGINGHVLLSSVHRAKGLEADRVFLIKKTFRDTSSEGEEANIRYVAITRAKKTLVWVTQ